MTKIDELLGKKTPAKKAPAKKAADLLAPKKATAKKNASPIADALLGKKTPAKKTGGAVIAKKATAKKAPAKKATTGHKPRPPIRVVFDDGERAELLKKLKRMVAKPKNSKELAEKLELDSDKMRSVLFSARRLGMVTLSLDGGRSAGYTVALNA